LGEYELKYSVFGTSAILVQWPSEIDEYILNDILEFKKLIQNNNIKQILEIINTYNSLLIKYDFTIDNFNDKIFALKSLYASLKYSKKRESKLWKIPVCYDATFALDLDDLARIIRCSQDEIIAIHSAPIYTVFFIGFLPGFLYLGGLDKRLYFDRKKTPNPSIKKGSVGIGGQQTGIYPQNSPGGWHIIGNSPIEFFHPKLETPCFANAGDKIQFIPIGLEEYRHILNETFNLKPVDYNG